MSSFSCLIFCKTKQLELDIRQDADSHPHPRFSARRDVRSPIPRTITLAAREVSRRTAHNVEAQSIASPADINRVRALPPVFPTSLDQPQSDQIGVAIPLHPAEANASTPPNPREARTGVHPPQRNFSYRNRTRPAQSPRNPNSEHQARPDCRTDSSIVQKLVNDSGDYFYAVAPLSPRPRVQRQRLPVGLQSYVYDSPSKRPATAFGRAPEE